MRHLFGRSLVDWTMAIGSDDVVSVVGGAEITFWSAASGGVRYTDLLDVAGSAVSSVVSSDGTGSLPEGTIPQFSGPDGVAEMWADAGGGARFKMVANDLGAAITSLTARLDNAENILTNLEAVTENVVLAVVYDEAAGAWPERPTVGNGQPVYWHGPDASPPPAGYMLENDQFFGWL